MPARSPRACVTWLLREALRTMARDAAKRFRELVAAGHEIPYDVEEPGNGSPCRGTSRSPSASSATTPRRCSSSTRSGRRARRSNPPSSRALPRGARDRRPARRPRARRAGRDGLPVPPVDGLHRLLARRRSAGRGDRRARGRRRDQGRRDRGGRPAARPADAAWCGSSWRRRRSFAPTRSRCRPRRGPRRGPAPPAGSPPSSPRRGSSAGEAERGRRRAKPGRRRPFRRGLPPADHRASPLPGRRRGPGALRVDARGRRSLAADRDRRRPAEAGRLPPRRGRARRPDHPLARARLPLDPVRSTGQRRPRRRQARWRGRSPASRRAWSETSCSRR